MPLVGFREGTRLLYSQGGTDRGFLPGMDLQGRHTVSMSHPMVQQVRVGGDADPAKTERQPRRRNSQRTTRRSAPEQEHKIPPRTLHRNWHKAPAIPSPASISFARRLIPTGELVHAAFSWICPRSSVPFRAQGTGNPGENRDKSRARSALSAWASGESSGEG
jgi:hypothetical protein